MKIYTSYFANLRNLPNSIIPIAICAKSPYGYDGKQLKALAPTYDILTQYKQIEDTELYTKRFIEERLSKLNPLNIYNRLKALSNEKDVALICYEKPTNFCHRHIVANWLSENLNIIVKEY